MNYKDKIWLEGKVSAGLSMSEIALESKCTFTTISKWMNKFGIKKPEKIIKDVNWLRERYEVDKLSISEISKMANSSVITVKKYIKEFGLYRSLNDSIRAANEKRIDTVRSKYGKPNVMQVDTFKKKYENTCLAKYGAKHPLKTKAGIDKLNASVRNKYGYDWIGGVPEIKNKIAETNIKRYGVTNQFQRAEIREKAFRSRVDNGFSILIDEKSIKDIAAHYCVPYSSLTYLIRTRSFKTSEELYRFIDNYKEQKSWLEREFELRSGSEFYNKKILSYRPDFRINNHTYANVDGLYWHSELVNKDNFYHYNMRKSYEDFGLQIFQFRADEIYNKIEVILSIISDNNFNISSKETIIGEVSSSDARQFLTRNHLGSSIGLRNIGLYYNGILISLLSYTIRSSELSIDSFSSKLYNNVIGGFSKLLLYAEEGSEINKIKYWVNLRYDSGKYLKELGFVKDMEILGWKWTDLNKTYDRAKCLENMDDRCLSENEHAKELGWVKIYDAGQRLWRKDGYR